MSSAKALSDKKFGIVGRFFAFNLRFYWQHFALCLIVTLLGMAMPSMISVDRYANYRTNLTERMVQGLMSDVSAIGILISIVAAVYFGMTAMAYANSKKQVGCYHSFPLKRESIFLTESVSRTIYYLISILLGYGLSYLVLAASLPYVNQFTGAFFENMAVAILLYLYVYHLFLLAGSLTGTDVMKFMMAFIITFLPVILYALVMVCVGIGNSKIYIDYYISFEYLGKICPPLRIVEYLDDSRVPLFPRMLNLLVEIVLYYAAALGLYKFRKSELTGTTIVWKPVFAAVKYLLIFTATIGSGYVFEGIFSGGTESLRMLFGNFFGFAVAFMLTNSILYRSARAMFRDLKKAGILAIVIVLFNVIVPFNAFGIIGKPYAAPLTDRILMVIDGMTIPYESEESVAYLTENLLNEKEDPGKDMPIYDGKLAYYRNDTSYRDHISLVQYPGVGIPLATNRNVEYNSDVWEWISTSDEYRAQRAAMEPISIWDVERIRIQMGKHSINMYAEYTEMQYEDEIVEVRGFNTEVKTSFGLYQSVDVTNPAAMERILTLAKEAEDAGTTGPVLGYIRVYHAVSKWIVYPIHANDLALINAIHAFQDAVTMESGIAYEEEDLFGEYDSPEEIYESLYDEMLLLVMLDEITGEIRKVDKDTFLNLAEKTAVLSGDRSSIPFAFVRESFIPYALIFVEGEATEEDALAMIRDYVGVAEMAAKYYGEEFGVVIAESYSGMMSAYTIRFRHDAITGEEAGAVFDSLGK